jgi:serine/threonine-protein kinase HipA
MKKRIRKCLCCYQKLETDKMDFHAHCARRMFGAAQPPVLDFDLKQLDEIARQIVIKSIAVTGVQPKLSLQLEKHKGETSRLTIVGLYGDYILKPPSQSYADLPQNEDVTMHLAAMVKINTAAHCLIRLTSGELAYITKRFDRHKNEKIAVEDLCQLSENLTEHKYRGSIEKMAKVVKQHVANTGIEMQRLFELVLFCYLTGNADMHLKNFALIENAIGFYQLSPAYDLLSTALVLTEDKEESALNINGKKNRLQRNDFDALAANLNIHEKSLQAIYKRFNNILPDWIGFIKQSFLSKPQQTSYGALIEGRHKVLFGGR